MAVAPTRILIDDHAVVREGLRTALSADPALLIVGEAVDGDDACVQAAALQPDVVIMDLVMPGLNGSDATRRLLTVSPGSKVVALTIREEPVYVREALRAGARGYVLKRTMLQDLLRAIHIVISGGVFLDAELASQPHPPAAPETIATEEELSLREIEVGSLAALGHSNADIAATLRIATKTVESHKTRLMEKLGLRSRAELVRYAMYRGWLK